MINAKLMLLYNKIKDKMKSLRSFELLDNLNTDEYNEENTQWLFEFLFEDYGDLFFKKEDRAFYVHDYLTYERLKMNSRNFIAHKLDESIFSQFKKRKLLNAFSDSLTHVDRLFNHEYGYALRKVPAHVPHLIDIDAMSLLQAKFSKEFAATSAHRFRHAEDMQYAFSYYYYIMDERDVFEAERMFESIDLNKDEYVDEIEATIVLFKLISLERATSFSQKIKLTQKFTLLLNKCRYSSQNSSNSTAINQTLASSPLAKINFLSCKRLVELLKVNYWFDDEGNRFRYKFELVEDSTETEFVMVSGNPTMIRAKLEYLAQKVDKISVILLFYNLMLCVALKIC
jgi:UDP-N-acetylglucosamine-lysosomal-enzyme